MRWGRTSYRGRVGRSRARPAFSVPEHAHDSGTVINPVAFHGQVEGSMVPVLGSIANAIYDAIGVRMTELPITPQKILKALEEKKQESSSHGRG